MNRTELVRTTYEAWNRRDFDAVLRALDEDVDWRFYGGAQFPDTEEVYRGHEGVRRFWATFIEPWKEITIELEEIRLEGDTAILFIQFHGIGAGSGVELWAPFVHVVRFRGDKATQFAAYADRERALADAGLAERPRPKQ